MSQTSMCNSDWELTRPIMTFDSAKAVLSETQAIKLPENLQEGNFAGSFGTMPGQILR